jgi:hypothetical protein
MVPQFSDLGSGGVPPVPPTILMSAGSISCLYVVYGLPMAIIMVGGLAAYVFWQIDDLRYKMLIYLTNQGFFLLTLHHLLQAFIVVYRVAGYKPKEMSFMYK